jgi:hypothetical protein
MNVNSFEIRDVFSPLPTSRRSSEHRHRRSSSINLNLFAGRSSSSPLKDSLTVYGFVIHVYLKGFHETARIRRELVSDRHKTSAAGLTIPRTWSLLHSVGWVHAAHLNWYLAYIGEHVGELDACSRPDFAPGILRGSIEAVFRHSIPLLSFKRAANISSDIIIRYLPGTE